MKNDRLNCPAAQEALRPMEVVIEGRVDDLKEMKELVVFVKEIEKEYSCNCTLKLRNY